MLEFVLEIALMFWITQEEIDNHVLSEPIPIVIVEEVILTPEEEFEGFLNLFINN